MKLTKIASIIAAAAFGLTANTALAQGGYGALSYFDWSVDQSGLSKEEQPQRHRVTEGLRGC
jgi:hypothetical protein